MQQAMQPDWYSQQRTMLQYPDEPRVSSQQGGLQQTAQLGGYNQAQVQQLAGQGMYSQQGAQLPKQASSPPKQAGAQPLASQLQVHWHARSLFGFCS